MTERQNRFKPNPLGLLVAALLAIERDEAIPFVARFLENADDTAGEAAFALAETHSPAALNVLIARQKHVADPWFLSVLLSAIALTRLPQAVDFLLAKIEHDEREAPLAIEALVRLASDAGLRARLAKAVEETGSSRLQKALAEHLAAMGEKN